MQNFVKNLGIFAGLLVLSATNNVRLADRWRPIWNGIFGEFKNTQFVLHHIHNQSKIQLPDNVEVYVPQKA